MKFQVTEIEFDFEQEHDEPDQDYQELITQDNLGVWYADDEDSLTDTISNSSGWCIKSIQYVPLIG